MTYEKLITLAIKTKENAYAPYSKFRVGAALIAGSDKVYTGVNVENSSFGATICAERSAITNAITNGEKLIKTIAITSDQEDYVYPCGICLQVLSEFCNEESEILCSKNNGAYIIKKLKDVLPNSFNLI